MSQENVELVHRTNDAFNSGDLDAFLEHFDPEVEFNTRVTKLETGGPGRGHDGIRGWWKNLFAASADFHIDIEDVQDLGDVTITRQRSHGHGRDSDAPMERRDWVVAEWRDGKSIWLRVCGSEAEAREAADSRR
jgi:ketosteroid isomerase-like protein